MEEKKTVQYKRTLRGTMGAGASALFNGNGRRFYVLQHRDASKYHKAGESQKIIVDQVELGRDANCQVRFDETFETVSRHHAAIVREGDRWKLVQLSITNTTFLNGSPVESQWYLENGDEIQLAVGGPRLGFIIPEGKQGLVSSIKLTERMDLFRKQALRPYKRAIVALAVLIVLLSCGGGYKLYDIHQQNVLLTENQTALKAENDTLHSKIESQAEKLLASDNEVSSLKGQLDSLRKKVQNITPTPKPIVKDLDQYSKDVYFIGLLRYTIKDADGNVTVFEPGDSVFGGKAPYCSGTGFMTADGTFITARHVIEPWFFDSDTINVKLNHLACIGYTITGHFFAVSSTGTPIEFSTDMFKINKSHDKVGYVEISEKKSLRVRLVSTDNTDYAYSPSLGKGNLACDAEISKNLKVGDKLKILGFPLGLGVSSKSITPIYSSAEVAKDGLTDDGYILTTATGFEHGNSGGPVFIDRNGKMVVVGIVSAGGGRSTGFVVPICVVK